MCCEWCGVLYCAVLSCLVLCRFFVYFFTFMVIMLTTVIVILSCYSHCHGHYFNSYHCAETTNKKKSNKKKKKEKVNVISRVNSKDPGPYLPYHTEESGSARNRFVASKGNRVVAMTFAPHRNNLSAHRNPIFCRAPV